MPEETPGSGSIISFNKTFLYLTLFVVGGVIMMLELLGTRILAPFFGTTIYTWSSLITVTLVALAIGYFVGGLIADRKPDWSVIYFVIFLACLWILLIPLLRPPILLFSNAFPLLFGSLFSAFALFTVPLFLLGMVTPFAVKLETDKLKTLGATTGTLFAISTFGSLLGTVLTGFYFIPNFGIGAILSLSAFSLFGVVAVWTISRRNWRTLISFSMVFLLFNLLQTLAPILKEGQPKEVVFKSESPYGQVKVVDKGNERILLIDNSLQTIMLKDTGEPGFSYIRFMEIAALLPYSPKDTLVIGMGGGLFSMRLKDEYNLNVETVEIDSTVVEVARKYFDFEGTVYVQDGRYFLQKTSKKYDIIVMDAFSPYNVPPHLVTIEMFEEVRRHLREGGVFVVNIEVLPDSKLSRSVFLTLKQVFPKVHAFPVNPAGVGNLVFFSGMEEMDFGDVWSRCTGFECDVLENMLYKEKTMDIELDDRVLTDSYNPVEVWQMEANKAARDSILFFLGEEVMLS